MSKPSAKDQARPITKVLVDTSLLIELHKERRLADPVVLALADYRFRGVSSYSRLEFKSAWLQRLAFIHERCRLTAANGIADVLRDIQMTLRSPYHRRRAATCLEMLVAFYDLRGDSLSGRAQMQRLRAHCKQAVLGGWSWLENWPTADLDGTMCARAMERPAIRRGGALDVSIPRTCNREGAPIECTIRAFFEENVSTFWAIAEAIDQHVEASEEAVNAAKMIRQALRDPAVLETRKNCSKIADAIIAVDGKDMDVFAANNDKEWVLLAAVLGKKLVNPVRGRD